MSEKKIIIIMVGVTAVILLGGSFVLSRRESSSSVSTSPATKVAVSKTSHNWGTIQMDKGNAKASFLITNQGIAPLVLSNVSTSCMCTTAQLSYKGAASPLFGMHSKSSYTLTVTSKESATLEVVFDPAYHGPSGVGPIERIIEVSTNDPSNQKLTFVLNAVVVK